MAIKGTRCAASATPWGGATLRWQLHEFLSQATPGICSCATSTDSSKVQAALLCLLRAARHRSCTIHSHMYKAAQTGWHACCPNQIYPTNSNALQDSAVLLMRPHACAWRCKSAGSTQVHLHSTSPHAAERRTVSCTRPPCIVQCRPCSECIMQCNAGPAPGAAQHTSAGSSSCCTHTARARRCMSAATVRFFCRYANGTSHTVCTTAGLRGVGHLQSAEQTVQNSHICTAPHLLLADKHCGAVRS